MAVKEKEQKKDKTLSSLGKEYVLILHNDDVNTFDFVIDTLVDVCNHNPHQAEQCALITHYKGKCDIKHGSFEELENMMHELLRRGLSATISTN
ncbi:MAG: ATP-dependent Clp protease adaptor protein ClpS [Tenuifilum sp.]|jgi:ATP-dependent Clp protease adaptor protein ClpS|uniref:ATP-dependent Clp protease adaptor ClpS n=1 Tax=Tenuifilum sp. TaxID=2760880 RepID=UPI0024AA350A|nr:ATP-dependent Clp protease adaptor ClpS [Tenuifilum sp.]MDI3527484.1 ATP-dependent Clp protease adaptor protein ClpS [Tenuifilum sp.]